MPAWHPFPNIFVTTHVGGPRPRHLVPLPPARDKSCQASWDCQCHWIGLLPRRRQDVNIQERVRVRVRVRVHHFSSSSLLVPYSESEMHPSNSHLALVSMYSHLRNQVQHCMVSGDAAQEPDAWVAPGIVQYSTVCSIALDAAGVHRGD